MRVVVLGSGTSMGVPVVGCRCEVCVSTDPRDRRTRVGALVEGADGRRILIDTPPELRLQLLAAGERVVVTAGLPFDQPGTTNLIKVEIV